MSKYDLLKKAGERLALNRMKNKTKISDSMLKSHITLAQGEDTNNHQQNFGIVAFLKYFRFTTSISAQDIIIVSIFDVISGTYFHISTHMVHLCTFGGRHNELSFEPTPTRWFTGFVAY